MPSLKQQVILAEFVGVIDDPLILSGLLVLLTYCA